MKSPALGQIVLYVPLVDEPAQAFVAASNPILGEAVIQPLPAAPGYRAATIVGLPADADAERATLLIYKQSGNPYRDAGDAVLQRLAEVPYSGQGIPGTWLYEAEAEALQDYAALDSDAEKSARSGRVVES